MKAAMKLLSLFIFNSEVLSVIKKQFIIFIIKTFIFSLPFLAAFGLFVYCEPYDYWGIFNDQRGYETYSPLPRFIYLMNHKKECDAIFLGDSRTATLPNKLLSDLSGMDVINLAVAGQSLNENIDTFWFAVDKVHLKRVYFQISFWTMNTKYYSNRIPETVELTNNVVDYITNKSIQKETLQNVKLAFFMPEDILDTSNTPAEETPATYTYAGRMEKILQHVERIYSGCLEYSLNYEQIDRLKELASYCKENDIELIFFTPPLHMTVFENVIVPLGLEDVLNQYKQIISTFSTIYDLEYESSLSALTEDFADGFHFSGRVKDEYLHAIFTGQSDFMRVWENGKQVTIVKTN